jgi:hypothetical protein
LEAFDRFDDRYAHMLAGYDDLAAGDDLIVGENPRVVIDTGVQFDDRAATHFQKLMDCHLCPSENDRDFNIDFTDCNLKGFTGIGSFCGVFTVTHAAY